MKIRILALLPVFSALFLFTIPGQAQQPLQVLHHHVRSAVSSRQAPLVGSLPPEQRMNLSIVLPLRNQADLTTLLNKLYDPSSPDYRHFLSVDQFTEQFSPTVEDYQAVVDFARANGFTVTDRPANRMLVAINGSVEQIEKTFNVKMRVYRHPTENRTFISPDREPSLALSVAVAHIVGLNNYSIPRPMVTKAAEGQGIANAAAVGSGPGGSYLASDMRAAYYGGTALTGSGQTVGLLEFDGYNISDVTSAFDGTATSIGSGSNYLLNYMPSTGGTNYGIPINNVLLDGATGAACQVNPGNCADAEQALDIVQAIGMAPGIYQVRVYIGSSDVDILNAMATENTAKQLSISWAWSPDDPSTDDFIFQEFAAQGQSVFAASGDDGAFDPLEDVFYPGEDAWLTAVGATDLTTNGAGGSWSSETAWDLSGGGISPDNIPIPNWQAGVANSSNGGSTTLRNVPDVAAEGDFDNYDCNMGVCQGTWAGTSFAAPRWAGFMALVNQQAVAAGNPSVGFINPAIYAIGEGSGYDSDFHDITIGNNGSNLYLASGLITLPGFNAVTGYDLITGWGSPAGQGLIDALAPPASAGFLLAASPSNLTIAPGASATTTISVTDVGGFTGSVNLSVSGLPSGVTASMSANPAAESSLLTLTVGSTAVRGSYLVTITGTSGSLTATTSLALDVNAPGFTLGLAPTKLWINAGTSGTATISVIDYAGFTGSVSFAVTSGLPSGVTAAWTTNPTNESGALTLTASNSATVGVAMVTITGVSGALSATTTIALTVYGPEFNLNISPYPYTIVQGGSTTSTVTVVPLGNFAGSVTLEATELPAGVTAAFSPNPTTGTSVLTMTAGSSASLGTTMTQILGNGGYSGAGNQFFQTVTAAATPTFSVGLSPVSMTLTPGSSGTATVTVTNLNGFTGNVTLTAPYLPSGVTATFGTNPTTGSSILTLTASSTTLPAGFYSVGIAGTSGSIQNILATLFLTVNPAPSFTLGASPSSLTVSQSASVTDTITVTPQAGFTGNVTLSAPNMPSGLTASFGTNPTAGTSLLTLTADCTVHPGSYLLIVAGSTGVNAITLPLALTVNSSASCVVVPTTTALSINPSGGTLTADASYTLTATVSPVSGSTTPTGNVVFTIGSATQTVALNSSGIATYNGTAPATAGGLALSAAYLGTTQFSASTSNTLNETVTTPITPSFTMSSTAVTVSPGATTANISTVTLTPAGGFTGSVALTASVTSSPTGAQYPPTLSFGSTSPVSITGTTSGIATLTITTTAATSSALAYPERPGVPWYAEGGAALACLLLFGIPARRRSWRTILGMLTLLAALTASVMGCGGGGNGGGGGAGSGGGGGGISGTTAGAYTITVTGTSGSTTETGTVTLTVQ